MSIKNILKAGSITFNKYRRVLMPVSIAMATMLFAVYTLATLFLDSGLGVILVLFLLMPCLVGLKHIARRCALREDSNVKDFYFGFKNFRASMRVEMSTLVYGYLWMAIGMIVGLFGCSIGYAFYATTKYPELFNYLLNFDLEHAMPILESLPNLEAFANIALIISVFIGGLLFASRGLYRAYTCFITFDSGFTLQNSFEFSKVFLKTNKKSFFRFNVIFLCFFTATLGLSIGVNTLLKLWIDIPAVNVSISALIFFILASIILEYYILCLYHSYHHYLRDKVLSKYEEFKNKLNDAQIK